MNNSNLKDPPTDGDDDGGGGDVAVLNDDVVTEILLRLSVKSVTKFKSVSRRWLSAVSTDHFRRLHTLSRRPKPPPSLILNPYGSRFLHLYPITQTTNPTKLTPFDITLNPNNNDNKPYKKMTTIVSSCNGLLLLKYHDNVNEFFVYNPSTMQSRKLILNPSREFFDVIQLHLVFDPIVSIHYKIVCVRVDDNPRPMLRPNVSYRTEVFDSESGTWSVIGEPFVDSWIPRDEFEYYDVNFGCALHCNNMIYGITNSDRGYFYCFDIKRNALYFLPRPTVLPNFGRVLSNSLEASNGCLYYITLQSCNNRGESVLLWELLLERDNPPNSKWLVRNFNKLNPKRLGGRPSGLLRFIVETNTLLIDVQGKIVAFNFSDKSYHELLDLKDKSYWDYHHMNLNFSKYVYHFSETLVPL